MSGAVESNGLAWRDVGAGRPILFVHGLGGSARTWSSIARSLRDGFRVLSVDLPGHGDAAAPVAAISLDSLARDLVEGLRERGAQDAVLVGHSVGGFIALRVALSGSGRGLVLISSEAGRRAMSWLHDLPRFREIAESEGMGALFDVLRVDDPAMADLLGRHPELVEPFRDAFATIRPQGFVELARAARERTDVSDRVADLALPSAVIVGELDRDFRPGAEDFAERAGSRLTVLTGLGHMPMLEDPGRVAAGIVELTERAA